MTAEQRHLTAALATLALMLATVPAAYGTLAPEPSFRESSSPANAPPGTLISIQADLFFDNAGTNPKITDAVFSTTEYYNTHSIGANDFLFVQTKTNAELNALSPPPSSPFEVTVDLTMENDEGQTASGTLTLETNYERSAATPAPPEDDPGTTPTLSQTEAIDAPPGETLTITVDDLFDNAGTNPVFVGVGFHTTSYLGIDTGLPFSEPFDILTVEILTNAELNALATPPEDNPFTFKADVTVSNDEGQSASGTITFSTTWIPDDTGPTTQNWRVPDIVDQPPDGG